MTTTMPEENPKRGDVVLVLFPHSDLPAITRSALIVQANDLTNSEPVASHRPSLSCWPAPAGQHGQGEWMAGFIKGFNGRHFHEVFLLWN
jgi:hypothetical protein